MVSTQGGDARGHALPEALAAAHAAPTAAGHRHAVGARRRFAVLAFVAQQ
jgi:hypothetical protein